MKSSAPRPPRAAAGHGGNPILLAIAISIASCHTVATAAATGTGASRRPTPQLSVTAVYMEQSKGVFSVNTYRAPAHGQDGAPMALANVTAWRRPSCSLGGRIAFGPWFKKKSNYASEPYYVTRLVLVRRVGFAFATHVCENKKRRAGPRRQLRQLAIRASPRAAFPSAPGRTARTAGLWPSLPWACSPGGKLDARQCTAAGAGRPGS